MAQKRKKTRPALVGRLWQALTHSAAALATLALPAVVMAQNTGSSTSTEVQLFQAGQVSWEWLLIPANHGSGAQAMRNGTACLSCHDGEASFIGDTVASTPALEPDPIANLPGFIDLSVQSAIRDGQLHLQLSWLDLSDDGPAGESEYPAQVTASIADDTHDTVRRYSCWSSCHSDLPGMSEGIGSQLSKYLPNSRSSMTRTGGGDNFRPDNELAEERERGAFLEYWHTALAGPDRAVVSDGHFLEAQREHDDTAVTATARSENGQRIVELQRPLEPQGDTRKALQPGGRYSISFAVYERNTEGRRHLVSFPLELIIEADAARIGSLFD